MSPVIASRALAAYRQGESTRPVVRAELTKEAGKALSAIGPMRLAIAEHEMAKIVARRESIAYRLAQLRASIRARAAHTLRFVAATLAATCLYIAWFVQGSAQDGIAPVALVVALCVCLVTAAAEIAAKRAAPD